MQERATSAILSPRPAVEEAMDRPGQDPAEDESPPDATREQAFARWLGPMPRASLSAMVDYGLSDAEIGRYYGLPAATVTRLRAAWRLVSRL